MKPSVLKSKNFLPIILCLIIWILCGVSVSNSMETYQQQNQVSRAIESHKKPDARVKVEHPLAGPYQAIVHLTVVKPSKWYCSGFVVGPRAVLTNKHCLKDARSILVQMVREREMLYTSLHP